MRIVEDSRSDKILRLEGLLKGFNYTVWVNTYGPFELSRSLEEQLSHSIGKDAIVGNQTSVSANEARSEVLEQLLHSGDGGYGPIDLTANTGIRSGWSFSKRSIAKRPSIFSCI